jgi:hypothetical protein
MVNEIFGHYRILDKLGSGGTGVVYKAEDTKLGRFVALTFLPPEMSQDPHALARFKREARAASALNHPHICTIYDLDEHQGQQYIVMELLEGNTLKDRIAEKPMTTEQVARLGVQLSEALEAAHSKGIVHRDMKPANVVNYYPRWAAIRRPSPKSKQPGRSTRSRRASTRMSARPSTLRAAMTRQFKNCKGPWNLVRTIPWLTRT